jgi:hypothetical protein
MVTRSTIPLAITSLRFQSNSWYLTDELPQFKRQNVHIASPLLSNEKMVRNLPVFQIVVGEVSCDMCLNHKKILVQSRAQASAISIIFRKCFSGLDRKVKIG